MNVPKFKQYVRDLKKKESKEAKKSKKTKKGENLRKKRDREYPFLIDYAVYDEY